MSTRSRNSLFLIRNSTSGFTLIELLVVMGIIAIMATVVTVAINPMRQFMNARDTERRTHLYSLTSALVQYQIDNDGNLPNQDNFPTTAQCIGDASPCTHLSAYLVPLYLPEIPYDPSTGTPAHTQYFIFRDANRKLIASASGEITHPITIAR